MSLKFLPISVNKTKRLFIRNWVQTNGLKLLLCVLLTFLLIKKDVTLSVSFNKDQTNTSTLEKKDLSSKQVPTALPIVHKKASQQQINYIQRFAKVAKSEMDKYGIPASIKLAQGLLESQAGASRLATKNNNHFGIKCFSKNCKKGHCTNFSDDSHKVIASRLYYLGERFVRCGLCDRSTVQSEIIGVDRNLGVTSV